MAAQRVKLLEIGIQDKKDQDVMLRFLYLGVLPPGYSAVPKDSAPGEVLTANRGILVSAAHQGVLFAQPAQFCTALLQLANGSANDVLTLFEQQSDELKNVANILRGLPDDQRQQALKAARIYLCGVK